MGKLIKEYSRATDWVYLALCVGCSVLSVLSPAGSAARHSAQRH